MEALNATHAWRGALHGADLWGQWVAPRGRKTKEQLGYTTIVDMRRPVVTDKFRKLNYTFMLAEAAWILGGDNRLEPLAKYNSRMREFSDDGQTLSGAYGVPFREQLDYVANKLREDEDTRQAVMTTWARSPVPSKDIPCTVALDFKIRDGRLTTQVFMRSSDLWLGLPYDIFAFSMMSFAVMERYYEFGGPVLEPGKLYITAASSHIYERDMEKARVVLEDTHDSEHAGAYWKVVPALLYDPTARHGRAMPSVKALLEHYRDAPWDRWWKGESS